MHNDHMHDFVGPLSSMMPKHENQTTIGDVSEFKPAQQKQAQLSPTQPSKNNQHTELAYIGKHCMTFSRILGGFSKMLSMWY
jgi:hypothetical protein